MAQPYVAVRSGDEPVGADPGKGYARLPGHMLPALDRAQAVASPYDFSLPPSQQGESAPMTVTLTLKRDDQAGFEHYLSQVYDPHSSRYRHFLTQTQLAGRFGPSRRTHDSLVSYLRQHGLQIVNDSSNRLTVSVRGTRAAVEQAFNTRIAEYRIGDSSFYANDSDPALPVALARHVQTLSGLNDYAQPQPAHEAIAELAAIAICTIPFSVGYYVNGSGGFGDEVYPPYLQALGKCIYAVKYALAYGKDPGTIDPPAPTWNDIDGSGQTVGLLEFDSFETSDVADALALSGAPASEIDNLSEVKVNGGATPGAGQDEVLLDIDAVMSIAPGAKVVVYDAPFSGAGSSFQALFNAAIDGGSTIISNSWAYCEDQTTQSDVDSIDSILQNAAASGITVLSASGDTGSTCLDGSANTVAVPADSPHLTAVGGSSLQTAAGPTYQSETWWDGSHSTPQTGQGGFGTSAFFQKPSYQNGLVSGSARSVPDVVANADPFQGIVICRASEGGCPNGTLNGGTSLSAPLWAGFVALLNQSLGQNIGELNPQIYPLASSSGAFHAASSMGSDFAHVGLGSPDLDVLHSLLSGQDPGTPDAGKSRVIASVSATASGVGNGQSVGLPADGKSAAYVTVRLVDANGLYAYGKTVKLSAAGGSATISPATATVAADTRAAVFTVTDATPETVQLTATDTTDHVDLTEQASVTFDVLPAAGASLNVFPTSVPADGSSTTTIAITLKDANGQPTPGKKVVISQGSGQSVISGPNPAVTDSNGQIQFTASDQSDETVVYTAIDASDGNLAVPGSGTVTFSGSVASDCTSNPPTGATGYEVVPFATGFAASDFFYANVNFSGCPGAENPIFDASGAVFVSDFYNGNIYKFDSNGGSATPGNITTSPSLGPSLGNMVYGKDGNVYSTLIAGGYFTDGAIVQIDPASGTILRTVASGYTCPTGLAVDPLSGDLFFVDGCFGAGSDDASLWRITDPGNTDTSNPTSVSVYATLPYTANGYIAFAPDGTMYVATGNPVPYPGGWFIAEVTATSASQPATVSLLSGINSDNGTLAIGKTNSDGSARTLVVHETPNGDTTGGVLETVDITGSTPAVDTVLAIGDIGIGTIGPDGCNYVGAHHNVFKLAPSSGDCGLTPSSPAPAVTLSPASVSGKPKQGTPQSFTASLKNVSSPAGVPIVFKVSGANPQIRLVDADASGQAVFSYTAANVGADTIVAGATVNLSSTRTSSVRSASVAMATRRSGPAMGTAHVAPAFVDERYAHRGDGGIAGLRYPLPPLDAATFAARQTGLARSGAVVRPAAAANTLSISSNTAQVTWVTGAHTSFLSLNSGPTGAAAGATVKLVASLTDVSASPAAAASGKRLGFTLGNAACSATTDSSGLASCTVTAPAAGAYTLGVSFAGDNSLTAADSSILFHVTAATSSGGGGTHSSGGGGGSIGPELLAGLAMMAALRRRKLRRR